MKKTYEFKKTLEKGIRTIIGVALIMACGIYGFNVQFPIEYSTYLATGYALLRMMANFLKWNWDKYPF
ncbi:MAG: hypothetical protein ACTSXD_08475 [Candidatus Heimdallarchaeaceae archaeon]